eukprot:4164854-Lingulodinium_polyedra.AAC.1
MTFGRYTSARCCGVCVPQQCIALLETPLFAEVDYCGARCTRSTAVHCSGLAPSTAVGYCGPAPSAAAFCYH